MKPLRFSILLLLFIGQNSMSFEPQLFETSYDCTKAGNKTEREICENYQLAQLDIELSSKYQILKNSSVSNIKENQINWIKKRNKCLNNTVCIFHSYLQRVVELEKLLKLNGIDSVSLDVDSCSNANLMEKHGEYADGGSMKEIGDLNGDGISDLSTNGSWTANNNEFRLYLKISNCNFYVGYISGSSFDLVDDVPNDCKHKDAEHSKEYKYISSNYDGSRLYYRFDGSMYVEVSKYKSTAACGEK
ncbi:hypothetical protein [Cellvibrio sp. NN19]|uniref:lysozyme inhibitor LprI family protein n=1 Tax=Cellvibrio chitinivorans TaxID=3102792 RepID=UPI002B40FB8B|nr:hypothetical protein [Cellvibrio sp. NN19]